MLEIEQEADTLIRKIKHYLITGIGRLSHEASNHQFYRAFSNALREQIMINWAACEETIIQKKPRVVYYLSMEYLPGRIFGNNITNLQSQGLVDCVLKKTKRDLNEIMACETDPGLGNGGLGRLASCFLDSLATLHYPARGYGLRYQYGIFEQSIQNGKQIELPDCWLLSSHPWLFRRDSRSIDIHLHGQPVARTNIHNEIVYELNHGENVTAIPYDIPIVGYAHSPDFSVATLRLWTTRESPNNYQLQSFNQGEIATAEENSNITHLLYPADHHITGKRIRLKQEFLLVGASLQDIIRDYLERNATFNDFSEQVRIQINDTHPALVIAELMRQLTKRHGLSWEKAWKITQECTSYTNHTVMKEALEEWDIELLKNLLPRQYEIIERINLQLCNMTRKQSPNDEDKVRRISILENNKVRMANLAIYGSHHVNGVAKIHSEILKKRVFKDFYEIFPEKFCSVTNGVTQRRWLLHCNPRLAQLITNCIGNEWITNFTVLQKFARYSQDEQVQTEIIKIKEENKKKLVEYILKREEVFNLAQHFSNPSDSELSPKHIDPSSIFDVQIKRIHEYKRQLMNALHILMTYHDFLDPEIETRQKRTFFIAGKAAPSYTIAKHIICLFHCIARKINHDPAVNRFLKVIFIENYNVSKAQMIIPAADLSEQISTAGYEASGTGNMKFSINGALTIGTRDGANVEMEESVGKKWWPFSFGLSAEEVTELTLSNTYNPWEVYQSNAKIKKVVDALGNGSLSENAEEQQALSFLHHALLEKHHGQSADNFFVLKDLMSYYETQKKVDHFYKDPHLWAEYVIHNISGMYTFSSDTSIKHYAKNIWGINPLPIDKEILEKVKENYLEHDQHHVLEKNLGKVQAFLKRVET